MEFKELTHDEYRDFLETQDRVYITELPEYGTVREGEGTRIDWVGLVDNGTVVGAAMVAYEPWRKVFRRAVTYYGPAMSWTDTKIARRFIEGLKGWVKRDPRVLALRVNPYVLRRSYSDVTPGEVTEEALRVDRVMADAGGHLLRSDYYRDTTVQPHLMYTKDLGEMDYDQVLASLKNNVRTDIRTAAAGGVKVEYLGPDDFDVLRDVLDHTEERTGMPSITLSALERARQMMIAMGSDTYLLPVAILDTKAAAGSIEAEISALSDEMAGIEKSAKDGRMTRKQEKQRRELQTRLDALQRRLSKTLAVRQERGDRVVLTASLFVETPTDLIYHHSGGYADLASFRGIYAIHEAMLRHAVDKGLRWYNMQAIPEVVDNDGPGHGVLEFKRHFQGDVEELVGTYEFPIRPFFAKIFGAIQ